MGLIVSASVLRTRALFCVVRRREFSVQYLEPSRLFDVDVIDHSSLDPAFHGQRKIFLRSQRVNMMTSSEKELFLDKIVELHIGEVMWGPSSGRLNENIMENADETHLIFNMDNGKRLGHRRETTVQYADFVSGGDEIKMMIFAYREGLMI